MSVKKHGSPSVPRGEVQRPGGGGWLGWIVASTLVAGATITWFARTFIAGFRLRGDDFALVLNSASRHIGLPDAIGWATKGYTEYFWNYPDWPSRGFSFARPFMNAALWLQSFLASSSGDSAYLLLNYAAVVALVPLTMLVLRRNSNVEPWLASVLALAVALSPAWYDALFFPSFGTNVFAAVFSVAALLALDPRAGVPGGRRRVLVVVLTSLAVLSHETAAVVPVVFVCLLYGMAPVAPRMREVAFLTVPLAVLVIVRAAAGLGAHNYVSSPEGIEMIALRLTEFVVGPLFPFNSIGFKMQVRPLQPGAAIPFYLGVAANVAGLVALAGGLVLRPPRKAVAIAGALVTALLPGFWMYGDPRFMGFSLVLSVMVLSYVTVPHPAHRIPVAVLLATATIALFGVGFAAQVPRRVAVVQAGGLFFDRVRAAIETEKPSKVVLVNDRVGGNGALAMLKLAASPRTDVGLVVINGIAGPPDPSASTTFSAQAGSLSITSSFAPSQHVDFAGCVPDFARANGGFRYTNVALPDEGGGGFTATSADVSRTVLVVGEDPGTGRSFVSVVHP